MTMLAELSRIALESLRANWFRAILTALGVVIGVAALIAVEAVSAGAQADVSASIRRLGGNVLRLDGELISVGTQQTISDRTITPEDITAIAALPTVEGVAPHQDIESIVVSSGRFQTTTFVVGMTAAYPRILNQTALRGRLISEADTSFGRSVAVVGQTAAAKLFHGQDPLGKTIRIGSAELDVIGIPSRRGKLAGENLDNRVFIPLSLVTREILGGGPNVKSVDIRVTRESDLTPTGDAITTLLQGNHAIAASHPNDFSVEDQATVVKEGQRATTTFRLLTFALGGISMLVGGIGIMNMMLVSVRERTREIGIRKAVGASPATVQLQFLIEALFLSTLGGIVGILAGVTTTDLIGLFAGWGTIIRTPSLVIAFGVALAIGLFFGYFPARRAAQLDPIVAMRYE